MSVKIIMSDEVYEPIMKILGLLKDILEKPSIRISITLQLGEPVQIQHHHLLTRPNQPISNNQ